MSSPLTSLRRLKDNIKSKWQARNADSDNPKRERQRELEAKWEKALKEYGARQSRKWANP
jgi:predicted nuclease of restriction endonuclease-like (RecB) superfamily